jgi:nucleoside-diphosphate-sugar epimerase
LDILLTGAFGNVGRFVTIEFLNAGYNVVAMDIENKNTLRISQSLRKESKSLPGTLTVHWGDLAKLDTLEPLFVEYSFSAIVHIAFLIPPFSETNPLAHEVNVGGTRRLLNLAEEHNGGVNFVFGSSTAVFGQVNPSHPPITMDRPVNAILNYAEHKIACEEMIKSSSVKWRILRFSAVMNPTFRPNKELLKYSLRVPPTTKLEPVHVKDLATAIHHALIRPETLKKTFIIAGGEKNRTTYKEYFERSLNVMLGIKEGEIPWHQFSKERYYLHWYDTKESQRMLTFQNRTIDDYLLDMKKSIPAWQRSMGHVMRKWILNDLFS